MSKFTKRIKKTIKIEGNALIVGDAFGYLEDVLELFPSVFVVDNIKERIKARNIIYRDDLNDLNLLPEIGVVFLDLKYKTQLSSFENLIIKYRPIFVIEGNDFIAIEHTKKFFHHGYKGTNQSGLFHIWTKIK